MKKSRRTRPRRCGRRCGRFTAPSDRLRHADLSVVATRLVTGRSPVRIRAPASPRPRMTSGVSSFRREAAWRSDPRPPPPLGTVCSRPTSGGAGGGSWGRSAVQASGEGGLGRQCRIGARRPAPEGPGPPPGQRRPTSASSSTASTVASTSRAASAWRSRARRTSGSSCCEAVASLAISSTWARLAAMACSSSSRRFSDVSYSVARAR